MSDLIPEHLDWMRAGNRSPRTVHDRERLLRHAEARLPWGLDDANHKEWSTYLANPKWSTWTRHTYFGHAHGFYAWGVGCGEFTLNPLDLLDRPPEGDRDPDPASAEELAQALALLPEQPWRMAVRLAAWAGLRCCEIVTVRREDCTAEWLRVRGKGGRTDRVPMAPALWAVIADRPAGLLVRGARGGVLTAQRLTEMQGPIWRRIGQPDQHMHRFRHYFGTETQRECGNIRVTQKALRHRSVRSTEGYTFVSDRELAAAVAHLGAPAGV